MSELISYGKSVDNIFALFGNKENDITMSLCWVMKKCPEFLKNIMYEVTGEIVDSDTVTIKNQSYDTIKGITDIEVSDGKLVHVIFEAKRGWALPSKEQLTKYSQRESFRNSFAKTKKIITLSECTVEYADEYLPFSQVNGIPVAHLPWERVHELSVESKRKSNHSEKHLLNEFSQYMKGIMTMQEKESNWVYVVSLNKKKIGSSDITSVQFVKKYNKYFCPMAYKGFPKTPPNYIGFRYDGKLQAIHHIEDYTVTKNIHTVVEEMPSEEWEVAHFVFTLGPAIIPQKEVKTGKLYRAQHVRAMLDTLLTSDTIKEAKEISDARCNQAT